MKHLKRIVSIILALTMVMAMAATAFAAESDEYAIRITGNKKDEGKHSYYAYQIFAGDLADNVDYKVLDCDEEHTHGETCYKVDATQPRYVLSNIRWGSGISDGNALLEALKAADAFMEEMDGNTVSLFADCRTAAEVAEVVSTFASSTGSNATQADDFAAVVSGFLSSTEYYANGNDVNEDPDVIMVNGAGYYMIKDADGSLEGQENTAYTRLLLQVVGNAQVIVKSEVPSGEKEVFYQGKDAYASEDYVQNFVPNNNLGDANYAGIGDHVSFRITSKVPNYTGYDYYYFIMNDVMSQGLTFDGAGSVTVKVGEEELKQGTVQLTCANTEEGHSHTDKCYGRKLTCTNAEEGHKHVDSCYEGAGDYFVYLAGDHSFRLAFTNIMDYAVGTPIEVTYSATVNEDAIIGTSGNENAWSLDYSRNPNFDYEGTRDEKQPGLPMDEERTPLGQTPEHKTLTYLTELDITKYANEVAAGNILGGAEFTLTGTSYQVVLESAEYFVQDEDGTYYKLLDGSYTEEEPQPDQFVSVGKGDENTEKGYLRTSEGVYYVPVDKTQYIGADVYKLAAGSAGLYASTEQKYAKEWADTTKLVPVEVSITLTTDAETGRISFAGLGEGQYTLTETKTPAGYNTINPISFTIKFTPPENGVTEGSEECTWEITGWPADEDGNQAITGTNGIFAANVINVRGALLPSTGGIGTTIFYVAGSILVLAAVVLLVTKKRMTREK